MSVLEKEHMPITTGPSRQSHYTASDKNKQPAVADRKHVRTQIQRWRWPKWTRAQWGYLSDRMESQHDFILQSFNRLQQVCNLHHH